MFESIYTSLEKIGYAHPLHPTLIHVPVGLVIGAFVFGLLAWLFRRSTLSQTAYHCTILALVGLFPAAIFGYMDWQYHFAGAWLFPIKVKLILAGVLLILLLIALTFGRHPDRKPQSAVGIYLLCLLTVIALGYFGGELVYGKKAPSLKVEEGLVQEGSIVFSQKCSACHYTDRIEKRIGPGLKGLFKREKLLASGLPATEANVRNQLKRPVGTMPSFAELPDEKLEALIAFMKTL